MFVFTAQFGELIIRLEVNKFDDEPARKLTAPGATVFQVGRNKLKNNLKNYME